MPDLTEEIYKTGRLLCEKGDVLAEKEKYPAALDQY